MKEVEVSQYITALAGVDSLVADGSSFFFYNPDTSIPPDHRFPFATIVTADDPYDSFSNLNRPSVFRLNIGVGKATFRSLFGEMKLPAMNDDAEARAQTDVANYDFTVLDQLMPHPVYGRMLWVSIINPTEETFEAKVRPLLQEAYEIMVDKYNKRAANRESAEESD